MRVAVIGRTEILYETALLISNAGHEIVCIITSKEAPEYTRTAQDFRSLSEEWGIPFAEGSKIIEHADLLRNSQAEIAVSMNYTGIFPKSVIDIFPLGVLNAHGGDLPRYRGNACQAWAILNGEERIAMCIHKMIGDELDSGDIISRDYMQIDRTTKVTHTWEWMRQRTPELMLEAIEKLKQSPSNILEAQSKHPKDALRCYPRLPEDGRIDWNQPAIQILRLINASNRPYSGAFCNFEDKRMRIWDAALVEDEEVYFAISGQVTAISEDFIEVACGSGKLKIYRAQLDDGNESSPSRFITSIRKRLK